MNKRDQMMVRDEETIRFANTRTETSNSVAYWLVGRRSPPVAIDLLHVSARFYERIWLDALKTMRWW